MEKCLLDPPPPSFSTERSQHWNNSGPSSTFDLSRPLYVSKYSSKPVAPCCRRQAQLARRCERGRQQQKRRGFAPWSLMGL
ncbi:hypothetical protein OJAV_G00143930 [Oryzias javanicus]|uniref:Uncharacterized protein n=1 Tax=Oryzias javanicus TaxID=123683 RepID=A0A437CMV5_ORYJA|nr:hypothetical protein OJAV_G00143930 [Oryzias javanicus]